jgi:hypothetical protein
MDSPEAIRVVSYLVEFPKLVSKSAAVLTFSDKIENVDLEMVAI